MVSDKIIVYITEPADGPLEIEVPYNPRFTAQLKQDIPSRFRSWKLDIDCTDTTHHRCNGRWLVDKSQSKEVLVILRAFYSHVVYKYPGGNSNFRSMIA